MVAHSATTPIPNGSGNFVLGFGVPSIGGGRLAFIGSGSGQKGVYTNATGALTRVADLTTPQPITGVNFGNFSAVTYDGVTPTFRGGTTVAGGIYSAAGAGLSSIVTTQTPLPGGGGTFVGVSDSISRVAGNVGFVGGASVGGPSGYPGVYLSSNGSLGVLADTTTPIPGGAGSFLGFRGVHLGDSSVFMAGSGNSNIGLYEATAPGGPVGVVVDRNTPVPSGTGLFTSFGDGFSVDGPNVAFTGSGSGGEGGVYAEFDGLLRKVADRATVAPDGTLFTDFGAPALSGHSVVFSASTAGHAGPALFLWREGVFSRIIGQNDLLGTGTIFSLSYEAEAIEGDTVAFRVTYNDLTTGAIWTATIPAPGALGLLMAAGVWAARRRR